MVLVGLGFVSMAGISGMLLDVASSDLPVGLLTGLVVLLEVGGLEAMG